MPSWASLAVAFLSGLATVLYDLWQRNQGEKAKIENVGLQQKQHEDLESRAAEEAIIRAQLDAVKELPPVITSKDFEQ